MCPDTTRPTDVGEDFIDPSVTCRLRMVNLGDNKVSFSARPGYVAQMRRQSKLFHSVVRKQPAS